ncbi:MAG: ABC transporter permease, partial [Gemmatimonadaceae bacterium]
IFKPAAKTRVDDELAFHIEMHVRDLVARGIDPVTARQQAEAALGNRRQLEDECRKIDHDIDRNERRTQYLSELVHDARFALRMLTRRRGFAAIAIATLTIGIGAATAIYSVVDGVLLKPLPFADPDRVGALWITRPDLAKNPAVAWLAQSGPVGNEEYQAMRSATRTLANLALYAVGTATVPGSDGVDRVPIAEVTSGIFPTLRLQMSLGRPFVEGDDALNSAPIALVSWNTWQKKYNGDSAILGKAVQLDQEMFSIVGVLPKDVRLDRAREPAEYWTPALRDSGDLVTRHNRNYRALVRLAPNATFAGASAELTGVLRKTISDTTAGIRVEQWQRDESRQSRPALIALLSAAIFLLGIACVNVAVLLLGESANRSREMAARAALGAGSGRLTRQLLVESLVIALISAVLGSALAWALMRGLVALAPSQLPGLDQVQINFRVLSFAMLVATATGLLFGVAPALTTGKAAVASLARIGTGQSNRKGAVLQRGLIAAQLALSTVLLTNALLLTRSFDKLTAVEPGFRSAGLSVVRFSLPYTMFKDADRNRAAVSAIQQRMSSLPGVEGTVLTTSAPFTSGGNSSPVVVEGPNGPDASLRGQHTQQRYVSADYLQTMGVRLLSGRYFNIGDNASSTLVAIVSATEVKRDFGGRNPLGLRVRHQGKWREVVGVVSDVKYAGLAQIDEPTIYVPFEQNPNTSFALVIKERGNTTLLAYRRALREVEVSAVVAGVDALPSLLAKSYSSERYRTVLIVAFAMVAALLAAVGMYGVGTRAAVRRTREVGIRLALGSTNTAIAKLMVGDAMRGVLIGLAIGIPSTLALGSFVQPFLFGVKTTDAPSYAATALLLVVVTLMASYVPSRRASNADPAMVLRGE